MQLILTMKPVWWPVLYHWLCYMAYVGSFSFDLTLNQDTSSSVCSMLQYSEYLLICRNSYSKDMVD